MLFTNRGSGATEAATGADAGRLGSTLHRKSEPDAQGITRSLRGGRWYGRYGTAPCPICQPESRRDQNGLTLANGRDGRILLQCKKSGCGFLDLLGALGLRDGGGGLPTIDPAEIARREAERAAEEERRRDRARRLWAAGSPVAGTLAERYLRARGISPPWPETLRFVSATYCRDAGGPLPALLGKVERGGAHVATHRTFLAEPGRKADVPTPKMALGSAKGGAVRLREGRGALVVAEGVETALSFRDLSQGRDFALWAALGTSGMAGLDLPPDPGRLYIARDPDAPGRRAAEALGDRAATLGWQVFDVPPPPDGGDWNDALRAEVLGHE